MAEEPPKFMMPTDTHDAAMQMMIDQLRRNTDAVTSLRDFVQDVREEMATMRADHKHGRKQSESTEAVLQSHDRRIGSLEGWRKTVEGRDSVFSWIIRSPIIGWLIGFALAVWVYVKEVGSVPPPN